MTSWHYESNLLRELKFSIHIIQICTEGRSLYLTQNIINRHFKQVRFIFFNKQFLLFLVSRPFSFFPQKFVKRENGKIKTFILGTVSYMFTDGRTLVFWFPDLLSVYSHPGSQCVSCLTNANFTATSATYPINKVWTDARNGGLEIKNVVHVCVFVQICIPCVLKTYIKNTNQ